MTHHPCLYIAMSKPIREPGPFVSKPADLFVNWEESQTCGPPKKESDPIQLGLQLYEYVYIVPESCFNVH